ncbi:MAG: hypothetical protein GDA54_06990, partial [Alphaproteobacteria bacterium GM7ARS4]|nr:hypothetical protein [Alphaproteobacteria bacterium GM7ARS4]
MVHENSSVDCTAFDRVAKKWRCAECDASFVTLPNYKRHLKVVHPVHDARPPFARRGEPAANNMSGSSNTTTTSNSSSSINSSHNVNSGNQRRLCFACGICSRHFLSRAEAVQHRVQDHQASNQFVLHQQAHNGQTTVHRVYFDGDVHADLQTALMTAADQTVNLLQYLMAQTEAGALRKVGLSMMVEMYKVGEQGELAAVEAFAFRSELFQLRPFANFEGDVHMAIGDIERGVEEFLFRGSGWRVLQPLYLDVRTSACLPLVGGGCNLHVASYVRKGGIRMDLDSVVLQGEEEEGLCLYYALAAHFVGDNDSAKLKAFVAVWGTPAGPFVPLSQLHQVEEAWSLLDVSINVVYQDEDRRVVPVRCSPNVTARNEVVLMLAHTANPDVMHYALVKNPNLLFAKRGLDPRSGHSRTRKRHICWNCTNVHSSSEALLRHKKYCHENDCQVVEMPAKGETISHQNGDDLTRSIQRRTFKSSLMLFYDFEALQVACKKTCGCDEATMQRSREHEAREQTWKELAPDEQLDVALDAHMEEGEENRRDLLDKWLSEQMREESSRDEKQHAKAVRDAMRELRARERKELREEDWWRRNICPHQSHKRFSQKAFAYCMVLVDRNLKVHFERTYVGEDAVDDFVQQLLELEKKFLPDLVTPGQPMTHVNAHERRLLLCKSECYLCKQYMYVGQRVVDHDHLTGKILGVAHNTCNLARREDYSITCFAHNFTGYDSHLFVEQINRHPDVWDVYPIPLNYEKFKCFTVNRRLQFLDSAAFLPDSLANLVENLKATGECKFNLLSRMTKNKQQLELLLRKGCYPYDFATSVGRLKAATSLPPISEFGNALTGVSQLPAEDYAHAQRVWSAFGCRDMLDYTRVYARSDVLQLAEAVLEMRENIWREFGLDLCKYLSLPMISKDIMLKVTGAEMELISDQEMAQLIKSNLRGGMSFINTRHLRRSVGDPPLTMTYVDANNLYGDAMTYPLPLRDFEWMTAEELDAFDPLRDATTTNGPGYILEVDLEYPEHLHRAHSSFPLAPHKLELTHADLSPYAYKVLRRVRLQRQKEKLKRGSGGRTYKSEKLTSTFRPRKKYLVHALNLKLYLQLGMKLTKVHRGIKFYQEDFIRKYIELCTQKRKSAPTVSLKNLYKLLANSLYGKLIEGNSKRMDCKMDLGQAEKARKYASSPRFKWAVVLEDSGVLSYLQKARVRMRQNWAVGFSVLEIS